MFLNMRSTQMESCVLWLLQGQPTLEPRTRSLCLCTKYEIQCFICSGSDLVAIGHEFCLLIGLQKFKILKIKI